MKDNMMRQQITYLSVLILTSITLSACTQSTPSQMNLSKVELVSESNVEQIPLANINETTMGMLADHHYKYGRGALDLTMTYDPSSKTFTAMKAVQTLKKVKYMLQQKGLRDLTAQTLAVPDGRPSLMVSYDMVRAQAPSDCGNMPGLESNDTTRFIGEYKFGCGVETLFAQQISNPSDLEGKSGLASRPARRAANVVDTYANGDQREPITGIERADLATSN